MESLRPDRDEVDSFQRSRNKTAKGGGKTPVSPAIKADKQSATTAKASKTNTSISVWLMMLVLAVVVSIFGWEGYKQQQKLDAMGAELDDALAFLRQSKLLMARFEGQLSETGAELIETGTDAQKKMNFLESEVRKLWGVAYDRNKKAIAANDKLIQQYGGDLKSIKSTLKQQEKSLAGWSAKANKSVTSIAALQGEITSLQAELNRSKELNSTLSAQLKSVEEASGSAIAEIRQSIAKLKSDEGVENRVRQNEVAIEAIDASRLQLNERIVALDRRLNDLQLSIKSAQQSPASVQ